LSSRVPDSRVRCWFGPGGLGLTLALGLLLPAAAHGQPAREIHEQYQAWWSVNSFIRMTDRFGAVADVHVRRTDFLAEPSFYFVRFGPNWWVSDKLTLTLGYAHMWRAPTCDGCVTWTNEDRVYQQLQYVTRLGKATVLHRLRNEERWTENVVRDVAIGGSTFSNRVRYLFNLSVPVATNPKVPALNVADELAVQFGPAVVYNTFDQNRLFVGVKQRLSPSWSFDLGYMMVYQQKPSGYQYDLNHTLRWFFYFTPDLRKGRDPKHTAVVDE